MSAPAEPFALRALRTCAVLALAAAAFVYVPPLAAGTALEEFPVLSAVLAAFAALAIAEHGGRRLS